MVSPQNFSTLKTTKRVLESEAEALKCLAYSIDAVGMDSLCQKILNLPGRVVITGVGKSGLVGAKIAATLASTGTPAQFVHTGDAGHGDLGMITPSDLVIALSNNGQSREFTPLFTYCSRLNIPLVGVTAKPKSRLAKASTMVICLPDLPEACPLGLAPMTSTIVQLAWGDALAACLIEARGFQQSDFALRHMGGNLGARTKTVAEYFTELDVDGNTRPTEFVPSTASFVDVTVAISRGRIGAVLVSDDLGITFQGIVTDGDIRRSIARQSASAIAQELMSVTPVTIHQSALLSEAMAIIKSRRINVIVVPLASGARLIHLQDLLKLGL